MWCCWHNLLSRLTLRSPKINLQYLSVSNARPVSPFHSCFLWVLWIIWLQSSGLSLHEHNCDLRHESRIINKWRNKGSGNLCSTLTSNRPPKTTQSKNKKGPASLTPHRWLLAGRWISMWSDMAAHFWAVSSPLGSVFLPFRELADRLTTQKHPHEEFTHVNQGVLAFLSQQISIRMHAVRYLKSQLPYHQNERPSL